MMGTQQLKATYGDNYERLVALKAKYRPDQLFPRESEHQTPALVDDHVHALELDRAPEKSCRKRSFVSWNERTLRRGAWRRLHLAGGYYLLFQFMVSFGKPDSPTCPSTRCS